MSENRNGLVHSVAEGGVSAEFPRGRALRVLAAPTVDDEFNTLRPAIIPIACWRLDDIRFAFDSSVVLPESADDFAALAKLTVAYPRCPVSLFGHADPVGKDAYNKTLSGRRARAVYAVLTRNVDLWIALFNAQEGTADHWGLKSTQTMLKALDGPQDQPGRWNPVEVDGQMGTHTRTAVKNFQEDNDLAHDGDPGPDTRKKLYKLYMDSLCKTPAGEDFKLEPAAFLGGGADPDGKGDYQGCGELNPLVVFSKDEAKEFDKPANKQERDAANAPNRRVVAFLFRPGTTVSDASWPCPKSKDGDANCKTRTWSDADARRNPTDARREYKVTRDTFGCRFYDRMARRSPCEAGYREWVVRVLHPGTGPVTDRKPVADTPFEILDGGGAVGAVGGRTDADGVLRVRAHASTDTMRVRVAGMVLTLRGGPLPESSTEHWSVRHRLYNLGYGNAFVRYDPADTHPDTEIDNWSDAGFKTAMKKFQHDHSVTETDAPDAPTKDKLREMHGS